MPVEDRGRLVVAAAGSDVIWIPGMANARWETQYSETEDMVRDEGWLFISMK